jgi:putative flippase GtrA
MGEIGTDENFGQTGSRNQMGPKTLPTIWRTYMKLVTKYQIPVIDSCWEKCAYTNVQCSLSLSPPVLLPTSPIAKILVCFLSNYWWQKSDIWSQASYRYPISWEAFLDPSDSYFLFADFVDFYTHWTYMLIFCRIFLSNYWWQKSVIWSQTSYRYPILWEAFLDPSDSYFLFAEERGYHKWALAHSSSS